MTYVFGACEIDCDRRELRRAGTVIHTEPQVFDVLLYLVESPRIRLAESGVVASLHAIGRTVPARAV